MSLKNIFAPLNTEISLVNGVFIFTPVAKQEKKSVSLHVTDIIERTIVLSCWKDLAIFMEFYLGFCSKLRVFFSVYMVGDCDTP